MRFTFPKKARLLNEREFKEVYRRGRRHRLGPLRFCVLRRPNGKSRLGLAVGRKVGNAVVRNRWKRAIREAFRLNRHRLDTPYDIVASVDWQAEPAQVRQVEDAFLGLVEKLSNPAPRPEANGGTDQAV